MPHSIVQFHAINNRIMGEANFISRKRFTIEKSPPPLQHCSLQKKNQLISYPLFGGYLIFALYSRCNFFCLQAMQKNLTSFLEINLFVKKQTFEEKWKAKAVLALLLLLKTNCPEFSCNNLHVWKISLFCTPRASASASCPASDGDQIKVKKGVVMGHPPLFNFWVPISEQEEVIFVLG